MKNYLIGALAGGLTLFALGFLIYVLILPNPEFTNGAGAAAASLDPINIPIIVIGELVFGFLITYVFHNWAGISTAATGAKAGAILGLLIALAFSLIQLGSTTMLTTGGVIYSAVTWAVRWAGAGAVVGLVLGKMKEKS